MYSCAMVPSGVRLLRIANSTFEVPAKYSGTSRLSVCSTSSCQAPEKRRRVPKSEILSSSEDSDLAHELDLGPEPPAASRPGSAAAGVRRKYTSDTIASTGIS
jgi:hypothetical protein